MARKRMFDKELTDTDKFLEMPLSTQALYFHLNMNADDDGFVDSPKKIKRNVGASDIVMRSDKMTRTNTNEIKIEQSTNWNNTQDIYNFRIGNDFSFELIKLKDKNGFRYRTPNDCIRAKAFEAIFNVDNLTTNEFFTNYIEREAK